MRMAIAEGTTICKDEGDGDWRDLPDALVYMIRLPSRFYVLLAPFTAHSVTNWVSDKFPWTATTGLWYMRLPLSRVVTAVVHVLGECWAKEVPITGH